jgi:hypothetical protein
MLFMNEYDIEEALNRFHNAETPNLFAGAQTIARLCRWTNSCSDGWPYWSKPVTAARKLIELLQAADRFDPQDCTEADLRKAYAPIKSFLTRQGADHETVFPTPQDPRKTASNKLDGLAKALQNELATITRAESLLGIDPDHPTGTIAGHITALYTAVAGAAQDALELADLIDPTTPDRGHHA